MISSDNYDCNKLLKKSQELDELILEAVKESFPANSIQRKEFIDKCNNIHTK